MVLMTLNEDQQKALSKFAKWYKDFNKPTKCVREWFEISGAAGTGKTTLAKHLFTNVGIDDDDILYVAYVGKATMALARNGLRAKTIHSAIYNIRWKRRTRDEIVDEEDDFIGDDKYRGGFVLKPNLGPNVKAIVVDEGSMVPEKIANDLLSFGLPVIVLGDLNQLPPVMGNPFFLQSPDVILTKIMRQAEDSPIIRLSQDILHKKMIRPGEYDSTDKLHIIDERRDGVRVDFDSFDAVIVGKNKTREMYNTYIRENVYKRYGDIQLGDKLICRKNNWDYFTREGIFLINGLVGIVTDIDHERSTKKFLNIELLPEGFKDRFYDIKLDRKMFKVPISMKREAMNPFSKYDLFEYAYAITCHLSQGSQYNNIFVKYENMYSADYCRKWLYTAVTRAIERMTLVL